MRQPAHHSSKKQDECNRSISSIQRQTSIRRVLHVDSCRMSRPSQRVEKMLQGTKWGKACYYKG